MIVSIYVFKVKPITVFSSLLLHQVAEEEWEKSFNTLFLFSFNLLKTILPNYALLRVL